MPDIIQRAVPWLRIDPRRVYAVGGSMGGQETLLLVARFPHLLAGAAAFDAPTNMAARYRAFDNLRFGGGLQRLARLEIGGTPATDPEGYEIRSPLDWARKIAFSGVPLQIWWSSRDTMSPIKLDSQASSTATSCASIRLRRSLSSSAPGRTRRR